MAALVRLICGPARTGKTGRLLTRYRQQLAGSPPGSALWIAPTQRSVRDIRGRLLDETLPGCFSPGVVTFDGFAELILAAAAQEIRPISSQIRRRLVARLLERAAERGELPHFGPIAHTDGLVEQITGWIRELKRLEVWPEHFLAACQQRGGLAAKDRELVAIYQAYQEALTRHALYDHEGRFWTARELLAKNQWLPVNAVRLVIVDGFNDFTDTQQEILQHLARHVDELLITLPLEENTLRADLFAVPLATLKKLQARHPAAQLEHVPRQSPAASSAWPTLDHLERQLFCAPQQAQALANSERVEILAASRKLGEVQLVGRRIKELLVNEKVRPGDVAVVFRSLTEAAPLVREVFTELGLPYFIEASQPLRAAPALPALAALLRLHVEDWPFRQLLALLTNNYFQPRWKKAGAGVAAEQLVRTLQVPSGREALLAQARAWRQRLQERIAEEAQESVDAADVFAEFAAEETEDINALLDATREEFSEQSSEEFDDAGAIGSSPSSSTSSETSHRLAELESGLELLERLAEVLAELPRSATLVEWGQALQRLASETGLLRVVHDKPRETDDISRNALSMLEMDRTACEHLFAVLSGGDRLAEWLEEPPPALAGKAALDELLDLLRTESLPGQRLEDGRVLVLSALNARTLEIPYLFLAGLSENSFPQPDRERLYTEAEARGLIDGGLPLASRVERSQAEMLLFYEVLTRPSNRLFLSYPALDEKAQPLSPSSYLLEVERACGTGVLPRYEEPDLSPLPRGTQPLCEADQRLLAVQQLLAGEPQQFARLLAHPPQAEFPARLKAGLEINHARQRGDSFGQYEGVLASDAAAGWLRNQYGPQYAWSASRLETYAYCPYQFFASQVLGVAPLTDLALEVDYGARGALLHAALSHIHKELNLLANGTATPSALQIDEFLARLDQALTHLIAQQHTGNLLEQAQREIDRRTLSGWGQDYHEQHVKYDEAYAGLDSPLRPAHFEVRFGPKRRDAEAEDPLSTDEIFELSLSEEKLRLTGRIDRIDRGVIAGQGVFNVLDYKSGRSGKLSPADIEAGTALQLPLYTMAAQELLLKEFGDVPWQAGYWVVRDKGFNQKHALTFYEQQADLLVPSPGWLNLRAKVLERVAAIVGGIRLGNFPMFSVDEHCTSLCDFHTVCRVNQTRALEKTWPAPLPVMDEGSATPKPIDPSGEPAP